MKKLSIIILCLLLTGCTWHKWEKKDKALFVAFTALNVVDILQTGYIHDSDKYEETNPLLTESAYLPVMGLLNVGVFYLVDEVKPGWRTGMLSAIVLMKLGIVSHNRQIGVGFKLPL